MPTEAKPYVEPPHAYDAAQITLKIFAVAQDPNAEVPIALELVTGLVDRIESLEKVLAYFAGHAEMAERMKAVLVTEQGVPAEQVPPLVGVWVQSHQGIAMTVDPRPFFAARDAYGRGRVAIDHEARVQRLTAQALAERAAFEQFDAASADSPAGNG